MSVPSIFRNPRALAALAIAAGAVVLIAPDLVFRGLPVIVLLACPLMMVFMMGPMHRMPAAGAAPREGDPYRPEALTRRPAELDAERHAIADLLTASRTDRPADRPSEQAARVTTTTHPERA